MTNITESRVDTLNFNSETKTLDITFNDLNILSTGGVDVLVLNLNEWNNDIPFYLEIDQRLFALRPYLWNEMKDIWCTFMTLWQ